MECVSGYSGHGWESQAGTDFIETGNMSLKFPLNFTYLHLIMLYMNESIRINFFSE